MKPSSLLALPVALGFSTSPAQDPPRREPVAVETTAAKSERMLALVNELLVISRGEGQDAQVATVGLQEAFKLIENEGKRRRGAERREQEVAQLGLRQQQAWVEAVSQLQDPARREQALQEIEAALLTGPLEQQVAACRALARLGEVKFDKHRFRAPVLALAEGSTGELRVAALYALYNTERAPDDLALALALPDDDCAAVRESGLHLLFLFSNGDLTGTTGEAALRILLADTKRQGINGLWGARVSPEITAHLLEMSRSSNRDECQNAVYFGLSTLQDKSREVVERLIELAPGPDHENAWRSRWGLSHGVPAEHGPLVAAAMRDLFEARSEPSLQVELLGLVGQYATSDYAPWLAAIEANQAQPDSVRAAAREALGAVQGR